MVSVAGCGVEEEEKVVESSRCRSGEMEDGEGIDISNLRTIYGFPSLLTGLPC
jgi:hypothetical protein